MKIKNSATGIEDTERFILYFCYMYRDTYGSWGDVVFTTFNHSKAPCKQMKHCWQLVGQQFPTLLDVTCYVRLHTLLHVVGCCCAKFETGQTFQPTTPNISFVPWSPKRSATMLDPFAQLFQHCWSHARSLRMDYKELWVVFFPRCTAGPKLIGSCCIRLHTTANTHATTPHIFGATMLGVVAPVCTQPSAPVDTAYKKKRRVGT